jgi:chromate transporter
VTANGWAVIGSRLLVLSLLQIGGTLAVAPELHRVVVENTALLTDAQFAAAIAIAQASPGPNVLYTAVIGYQVAGLAGALAALLAILTPSSLLAITVGRWQATRRQWRSVIAFKAGMAPITLGLIAATSWIIVADPPGWRHVLGASVAAVLVWRTRLSILWLIAAGAGLGVLGWF